MPIFTDLDQLFEAAAIAFYHAARQAVQERGRFTIALAGGSTPRRLYQKLALMESIPWEQIHIFFGDERFVEPTDPQSNERMARETLIDRIHPAGAHGIVREHSPEACAHYYEHVLRQTLDADTHLDLVLLGLGPDAHTLSLFPGQPAVHETEKWVVATEGGVGVAERITMTPVLVNRAREVWFLATGADKIDALRKVVEGPEDWDSAPAQAVARHASEVKWFVDHALADGLSDPARLG